MQKPVGLNKKYISPFVSFHLILYILHILFSVSVFFLAKDVKSLIFPPPPPPKYSYFYLERLDCSLLNNISQSLLGENDFTSFARKNTETENKYVIYIILNGKKQRD